MITPYEIEDKLTIDNKKPYKPGDKFYTYNNTTLNMYVINTNAEPDLQIQSSLNSGEFVFEDSPKTNKFLARVDSVNKDKVIIEIFMDGYEIKKQLKKYYISILKRKNLLYPDSEFYIIHEETENGLKISIEPNEVVDEDVPDILNQLCNEKGIL